MVYMSRCLTLSITPIIVSCIIWFAILKEKVEAETPDPNLPSQSQFYLLLFVGSSEYFSLFSPVSGTMMRLEDYESRMLHFLSTSRGSRVAYLTANMAYDITEKLISYFLSLFVIKLIITQSLLLKPHDFAVIFFYTLYDQARIMLIYYPFSYLFSFRKSLANYCGILGTPLNLILLGICAVSLSGILNESSPISYFIIQRIGVNLLIPFLPDGNNQVDKFRDSIFKSSGGVLNSVVVLIVHATLYYLLVIFIDYRSSLLPRVNQKADLKIFDEYSLKNNQEIKAETEYMDSVRPNIRVYEIGKTYKNKFTAASNVSFGVQNGQLFTLLGPNGAGKTSVLEVLCKIQNRTEGEVFYENEFMDRYNNKNLSFCLQKNYLWEDLTFREHVEIIGKWRGISQETLSKLIEEMDKGLSLGKNLDIKAQDLSGGNKRKLNTFLAMMAAPKIYILDEPTAGMDPLARR